MLCARARACMYVCTNVTRGVSFASHDPDMSLAACPFASERRSTALNARPIAAKRRDKNLLRSPNEAARFDRIYPVLPISSTISLLRSLFLSVCLFLFFFFYRLNHIKFDKIFYLSCEPRIEMV